MSTHPTTRVASFLCVLLLIDVCVLPAVVAAERATDSEEVAVEAWTIEHGALRVSLLDNARSPQVLSGIDSLTHRNTSDSDA